MPRECLGQYQGLLNCFEAITLAFVFFFVLDSHDVLMCRMLPVALHISLYVNPGVVILYYCGRICMDGMCMCQVSLPGEDTGGGGQQGGLSR